MFSSSLQRALKRGLAPGGNLDDALSSLRDYKIRTKKDARAIVEALSRLPHEKIGTGGYKSSLYTLVGLFQNVDGRESPAFEALAEAGVPELVRIFHELKTDPTEDTVDDLLFLLKMLALYGTHEGAATIVEAARIPLKPEGYMWSVILSATSDGHPQRDFIYRSLENPIPPEFIGVSFLDSANRSAIEGDLAEHPFDSEQGTARLRSWLTSTNPEEYSYAHSATAALPFLRSSMRNELLGLAREHADVGVQIEAGWASAKIGQEIGLQMLAEFCLDPNYSSTATRYLEELGRTDRIPNQAQDPDFQATAEFANWLAHPNELGRHPDELEIVDKRTIPWPPSGEEKTLWTIRYRLKDEYGLEADDVDCGLVGGTTWCFFSYSMHQRPPEDCLAIHCSWELGLEESDVENSSDYDAFLSQWPHEPLADAAVIRVVEIPPQLQYGRRLVALATGKCGGETGWAILDGQHSAWYPASEMPTDQNDSVVLKLHIGRRLLNFNAPPDRRSHLTNVGDEPTPEQFIAAYNKLLDECGTVEVTRRKELVVDWRSPLGKHLQHYAACRDQLGQESRDEAFARVYHQLLAIVQEMPSEDAEDAYGLSGPLFSNFEEYVEIAVKAGRNDDARQLIQVLEPHWDYNRGYGQLGAAAYKAGDAATAERLLIKLKESYRDWRRSEQMGILARLWHEQGNSDRALQLLIDCLSGLVAEASEATGSDRKLFEEWFQNHRTTYVQLFGNSEDQLRKAGIPESTLK